MADTAAQRAAAKADRIRIRAEDAALPDDLDQAAAEARASRTVRTRKVRRTVDLPPARHHKLTEWCQDEAMTLGLARVNGQDVINELIHLLLTDETTARKIHAALAEAAAEKDRR